MNYFDDDEGRAMPVPLHNFEAESSVLGGLMIDPGAWPKVGGILAVDHFFRADHKKIFAAIKALADAEQPRDLVTVADWLHNRKQLDDVGGLQYIGQLVAGALTAANIAAYAAIVADKAARRVLIAKAGEIAQMAASSESMDVVLGHSQGLIFGMSSQAKNTHGEPRQVTEIAQSWIENLVQRYEHDGDIYGVATGFDDLDEKLCGLQAGDMVVIAGRPGMGKELHNDSKVLMINGSFKRIGDVMVGESVASVDGEVSKIYGVFPQGVKPVYSITFSDGRTARAGLEHQWEVMYRDWESPRVLTTEKLISMLEKKRYQGRLYIQTPSGDFGVDDDITIHPYLLGVLLGDGGLSAGGVRLSNSDVSIIDTVKKLCVGLDVDKITDGLHDYRIHSARGKNNWLIGELKRHGIYGMKSIDKFIPENYLRSSKETRRQLIMGLIDTDGTVEKFGAMSYSTSSERLANDFISLARSLGFWAKMSSRVPFYTYKNEKLEGRRTYKISLFIENALDFISLPRKRNRLFNKEGMRVKRLNVESISFESNAECTCISVTHPRELFLCDDYIVTHNTTLAMNIAEHAATRSGTPTLVFSLEMPAEQIMNRLAASMGEVDMAKLASPQKLDESDFRRITSALLRAKDKPLLIDDTGGLHINQVRARARIAKQKHGIGMVVIDYLGLMRGDGKDIYAQTTHISGQVKAMAKELGVPVIILAQLNRGVEQRVNRRPTMADLRDSGAIEQDADKILAVYRDELYDENSKYKGIAEIEILKHRSGETGRVMLAFQGRFNRFKSLSKDWVPPQHDPDHKKARFEYA